MSAIQQASETREIWFYTPALLFTFETRSTHYKFSMLCADQNREMFSQKPVLFFQLKMEHSIVEYFHVWQFVDTKQVARSTIMVHKQLFLPGTVCC